MYITVIIITELTIFLALSHQEKTLVFMQKLILKISINNTNQQNLVLTLEKKNQRIWLFL
jgi:hypothetical protein